MLWATSFAGRPCDGPNVVCVVETDAIATDEAIANDDGAVTTMCEVPVPPAPSPSSSFANDREQRGDDEEEEWGSVVIGHHGPTWMSDGRMGEGIGASLTLLLLSRVGQNSGGRGEVE